MSLTSDFVRVKVDNAFYVRHKSASIQPSAVIRPFSIIGYAAVISKDVKIGSHSFIGPYVVIGQGSNIQGHAFIPFGVTIGRDVFIGPRATFTNCMYPTISPLPFQELQRTVIGSYAVIGANVTILPGADLCDHAHVGAGAVVTSPIHFSGTWFIGNPARPMNG
jgi:UDP-3-O-[3-hydroxymyristoyl] glucosamine N-acyltransferase